MRKTIIPFLLFTAAICGCGNDERYVKFYPQFEPEKKDSIIPAVQIFSQDTKGKEFGIIFNTSEFIFRTTDDEPLKISASKYSVTPDERLIFLEIVSNEKQCIDVEKEVNLSFADGTFMKFAPNNDDGLEPCHSGIAFGIRQQFSNPDNEKLWTKLLQVPLEEVRLVVNTKESNSIRQGLTNEQGLAFMRSVQMLDTATTGIPDNN